ncbi:hypothetical protein, partial [Photobacterium sp. BZF1]|uniref:hypothetical protein n=1 Tax=Photobacterium sp. BZF1 TaxID=1904457 RepID=UPI001CA3DF57
IKERTERFHVQSSMCHPSIRSGINDDAYPNGIKSLTGLIRINFQPAKEGLFNGFPRGFRNRVE